jgi:hypothetical protein
MENRLLLPSMEDEFRYDLEQGRLSFPCWPNTKVASCLWRDLQNRALTTAEIDRFTMQFRAGYNRALLCGARSGIVGIDLDDVSRGLAVLEERKIPLSPAQTRTWSGKLHLIYAHPKVRVAPSVKICGEPIDIRGDGSYLIAPGSVIDGKFYDRLGVWDVLPVYDPRWFTVPDEAKTARPSPLVSTKLNSVRKYIMKIVSIQGSNGSNACYRAACRLVDAGLSFDEALTELRAWSETNAIPKWSEKELQWKIQSAFNRKRI